MVFIDKAGARHEVTRKVSEGGEGAVYETRNGERAVKVLKASEANRATIEARLEAIRSFPLGGLPITQPLALLRPPDIGYVMTLVQDMTQVRELCFPPRGESDLWKWYLKGGGLRRRLRILARLAHTLLQLHRRGLAFGDLTPKNVMASKLPTRDEIFLIDVDNLTPVSRTDVFVQTRYYAAPEVQRQQGGISTLTDAHAFAVLAYQMLTAAHPLIGDAVDSAGPEMEDEALCGRLPWIGNKLDPRNESREGLHPLANQLLSKLLHTMFEQAFEKGLVDPLERPGMKDWFERLSTAADRTIACPRCKSTYYFDRKTQRCPYCPEPLPQFAEANVYIHSSDPNMHEAGDKTSREKVYTHILEDRSDASLCRFQLYGADDAQALDVELRMRPDTRTKKYEIVSSSARVFKAIAQDGRQVDINSARKQNLSSGYSVLLRSTPMADRKLEVAFAESAG